MQSTLHHVVQHYRWQWPRLHIPNTEQTPQDGRRERKRSLGPGRRTARLAAAPSLPPSRPPALSSSSPPCPRPRGPALRVPCGGAGKGGAAPAPTWCARSWPGAGRTPRWPCAVATAACQGPGEESDMSRQATTPAAPCGGRRLPPHPPPGPGPVPSPTCSSGSSSRLSRRRSSRPSCAPARPSSLRRTSSAIL